MPVRTTLAAMLIPRALFPIEGRAARMIRLPGWKPAVTASSSENPLETPVTEAPCSYRWLTRSNVSTSASWSERSSPGLPAWLTSNRTCSACEIRWFVSSPRSVASLVISRPASERRRIREWSRTISA